MDTSTAALRVLRSIAEQGSFTAAAVQLGYTQSAVSRQIAVLEREAGAALFTRGSDGARVTPAGATLLRHARVVLDELDAARRELTAAPEVTVRIGVFVSAGFALLPDVMRSVRASHPDIRVTTREGTSPALVRSVRAGTLDLAVVSARPPFRAPDGETPRLVTKTLRESELVVAVPASSRFAGRAEVTLAELAKADWITSPETAAEPMLGVWPGLPARARIAHTARDWMTKLQLVAAGCGVTTVTPDMEPVLPEGVELARVVDAPAERRRVVVARLPGRPAPEITAVLNEIVDRSARYFGTSVHDLRGRAT